ncbi:SNF-related serine/threonine-protein kinase-like [Macrosteles quadrilineatus]|uniref:SNF-related serine/threonine-protein kinase-like n=1 Tax=Macrosteles quadrilineatus TaxID=74068 RepID=UPI0023E28F35|nr:SNF-related serine/threonine-protein kinase-like [Macrosteles quadrilineatus]
MHKSRAASYDGKIAGLYDLEATLGSGHFAVVKLARHVFTGEKVAVKVIDKTKLDDVSRDHLFQEVRCMKLVQHPNVVRLYEVIDTQTKLYLILELGDGGDLYDYIMRHEAGLSEGVAREYFRQIVRAISYCHKLHVVHRDLKPENVVFFERVGVVKLTDFGFSNRFCPGQKLETSCGSLAYSAPEILLGDSYDAPAVDVWSLGVILYMLVCGQAPFQEANDSETLTMIMDCKYTVPSHVSDGCRRLIGRMLVRQPEKRATLEEIASDSWLVEGDTGQDLSMPLVSRQQLSDEDHTLIVQKMVNGKIATKEEILDALDKNEYNHITATYFLLAERKLRSQEPKQVKSPGVCAPSVRVDSCEGSTPVVAPAPTSVGLLRSAERARKCSIVAEEEDDEDDRGSCGSHSSLSRRGSRSEGKLHLAVQELRREAVPVNIITEASTAPSPLHTSGHAPVRSVKTLPAPLPTALSSPQIGLGEISEEGKEGQAKPTGTPRFTAYEQRRNKFRKTRTASCSSSDASDEDSEGRKKRGSTKSLHRGRDPQDPGGSGGGSGGTGGAPPPGGSASGGAGNFPPASKGLGGAGPGQGGPTQGHRQCLNSRHRRRAGETRLRESQSLNRITEVQEGEPPVSPKLPPSPVERDAAEVRKHQSKRNALIGRYLSLQRKLCVWSRGRVRKDINQNLGSAAVAVAASIGMCHLHSHMGGDTKCCNLC